MDTRNQPEFRTGTLNLADNGLVIHSDVKISGVASGQFGTIYHATEPIVLGSGVIE